MITSDTTAADANSTGLFIEIDAILAVVIGGTSLAGGRFSIAGTVIGAFIIQTMTFMIPTSASPPRSRSCYKAAVVAAVCLIQSPEARGMLDASSAPRRRSGPTLAPVPRNPSPPRGRIAPQPDVAELLDVAVNAGPSDRVEASVTASTVALPHAHTKRSWDRYLPVTATGVLAAGRDRHRRHPLRQLPHRPDDGQHPDQRTRT